MLWTIFVILMVMWLLGMVVVARSAGSFTSCSCWRSCRCSSASFKAGRPV